MGSPFPDHPPPPISPVISTNTSALPNVRSGVAGTEQGHISKVGVMGGWSVEEEENDAQGQLWGDLVSSPGATPTTMPPYWVWPLFISFTPPDLEGRSLRKKELAKFISEHCSWQFYLAEILGRGDTEFGGDLRCKGVFTSTHPWAQASHPAPPSLCTQVSVCLPLSICHFGAISGGAQGVLHSEVTLAGSGWGDIWDAGDQI